MIKSSIKYLIMTAVLVMAVGCEDSRVELIPDDDTPVVEIPEYGYIYFDSEAATRGSLYETDPEDNRLKADFGVIGYTHSYNDWNAAEPQAKPNVFYRQNVIWDGSVHSYSPLQTWHGKQMYAFFAYYPTSLPVSGQNYEGNPYVDFTFSRNNLAGHVDVMTSHVIDADYRTRSVAFDMKHRLTALDVVANNLYEDQDEIRITSMSITLNNLLFDKVRIPLNMRDEPELDYYAGIASTKTATYNLLPDGTLSVTDQTNTPLTSSAKNTTMILIPQNQYYYLNNEGKIVDAENGVLNDFTITGKVNVAYKTINDGTETGTVGAKDYDFTISRDLVAGYRYYIQLNFAAGDVTIAILESDMWTDKDINYDFE